MRENRTHGSEGGDGESRFRPLSNSPLREGGRFQPGERPLKPSTALFNQPRLLGDLLDGAMFFADFCNELFRGLVVGDHSQVC